MLENDFKKFGFGSGKINANVQPKLAEFMHVKRVPALVVVFKGRFAKKILYFMKGERSTRFSLKVNDLNSDFKMIEMYTYT